MSMELWRRRYRSKAVPPVVREVARVLAEDDEAAPVLCVTGDPRGAAAFTQHWLPHISTRGRGAYAVSVRGQGETSKAAGGRQAMVHDLVQEAVRLPKRAILIGHDRGALLVAHALTRYPAAAAVLLAPRGVKAAPAAPVGSP
ncbi:MAG: alpha/beta fold hydrolase, partial [Stackebrandtia sp.]